MSSNRNPYHVVKDFEAAIAEYTGAPYVVAVNSCTSALLLAVRYHLQKTERPGWTTPIRTKPIQFEHEIEIPKRTYVSVPMAIIHAGGTPTFRDEKWQGWYRLKPLFVWDSARFFSEGMYRAIADWDGGPFTTGGMVCVSFHASKTLGLEQGGAILLDDPEADAWLRRARFDGRTEGVAPKDDKFDMVGWHCYMNPSTAAQGILRLHSLPKHNAPLPNDEYPPLDEMDIFK